MFISILRDAGYPTDILCLDFETRYDTEYSLGKMPIIEYVMDERFELTGLGFQVQGEGLGGLGEDTGAFIKPHNIALAIEGWSDLGAWDSVTVLVQNARFDVTILQTKFDIVPKYIIDLKDLACHYDARMSHKLKDMAKMFGLKPKGDTQQFKGLHWNNMTSEQHEALTKYTINDVELETKLFKILLPKLTNPVFELQLMRHTLDLWLHKRFAVDTSLASQIRVQMRGKLAQMVGDSGHTLKELRSKKFVRWLQEALPDGEDVLMKQGKRGNIPALAKDDEACQQLLVHPKKEVRDLVSARVAAKSWPTHIKRVGSLMSQARANGGLLRVPLTYYPSHTGRWGGSEKVNLQNMGGRGRGGVGTDPLISQVREVLMAPDGYVLGIADSAQIEARVLAWLADQNDLLRGFAAGKDVYSEFATTLFHSPVRKPKETDPKPVAKMLEIRRGFGKDAVLGAGYGMGAAKFHARCRANLSLRPLFDSGQYDFKFIKRLIEIYRTTYAKIPQYWTTVERAFKQCIRFPHLEPTVGQVTFRCRGSEVQVKLPSSRVLYYRHCRIDKKGTIKWQHGALWGGSVTENLDQAISRDLLGFWILECEKAGLPVVLHVHDEVVTLLPEDRADELSAKLEAIMCSLPDWAEGLPVAAEVKISKRYGK